MDFDSHFWINEVFLNRLQQPDVKNSFGRLMQGEVACLADFFLSGRFAKTQALVGTYVLHELNFRYLHTFRFAVKTKTSYVIIFAQSR